MESPNKKENDFLLEITCNLTIVYSLFFAKILPIMATMLLVFFQTFIYRLSYAISNLFAKQGPITTCSLSKQIHL